MQKIYHRVSLSLMGKAFDSQNFLLPTRGLILVASGSVSMCRGYVKM